MKIIVLVKLNHPIDDKQMNVVIMKMPY